MGYSKSKRAIRRVEPYLKQMVDAQAEITFPADDASKFAYDLRGGIKASREFAIDKGQPVEPYASYQSLNAKYIIRTKGQLVVCEPRDIVPVVRLRETLGQVRIPEVTDTLGILGAAITHKAPVMIFPDARSSTCDTNRLVVWAHANGYYVVAGDNHITLTKNDPGELAVQP